MSDEPNLLSQCVCSVCGGRHWPLESADSNLNLDELERLYDETGDVPQRFLAQLIALARKGERVEELGRTHGAREQALIARVERYERTLREIKLVCEAANTFANPPAVVVQIVDEALEEKL